MTFITTAILVLTATMIIVYANIEVTFTSNYITIITLLKNPITFFIGIIHVLFVPFNTIIYTDISIADKAYPNIPWLDKITKFSI